MKKEAQIISECRKRKNALERLLNDVDRGYIWQEDRSLIKLSIRRSIAIEELNIKKLQGKL